MRALKTMFKYLWEGTYYRATLIGELVQHTVRHDHKHFNKIIPGLYLGGLPIKDEHSILGCNIGGHASKIIQECLQDDKPLTLVISALEQFELNGNFLPFNLTRNTQDWQEMSQNHSRQIEQIKLATPDNTSNFDFSEVIEIIQKIHHRIQNNQSVFVHCKAGKGRSWAIVVAYLATIHLEEQNIHLNPAQAFTQAKNIIIKARPQVNPSNEQINWAKNFIIYFQENPLTPKTAPIQTYP